MAATGKRSRAEMSGSAAPAAAITQLAAQAAGAGALDLLEGEEVKLQVPACKLVLGSFAAGTGTVFVSTSRLAWMNDANSEGFAVAYPSILLHAVCKDEDAYPEHCILCHLNTPAGAAAADGEDEEDVAAAAAAAAGGARMRTSDGAAGAPAVDVVNVGDLRIVPGRGDGDLGPLFEAMSTCAAMHPDPDAGDEDDEGGAGFGYGEDDDDDEDAVMGGGGGGWFTAASMMAADGDAGAAAGGDADASAGGLSARQAAALAHWDSLLVGGADDDDDAAGAAAAAGGAEGGAVVEGQFDDDGTAAAAGSGVAAATGAPGSA